MSKLNVLNPIQMLNKFFNEDILICGYLFTLSQLPYMYIKVKLKLIVNVIINMLIALADCLNLSSLTNFDISTYLYMKTQRISIYMKSKTGKRISTLVMLEEYNEVLDQLRKITIQELF